MSLRRRKQREDYDPNYVPPAETPEPTETPETEDPDFAPGGEGLFEESDQYADLYVPHSTYEEEESKPTVTPDSEPTHDPYANVDETDESQIYVSRSTHDRLKKEKPPEPVFEDVIQEHQHLVVDDLVDDDPEMDLGDALADDYLSRSTYVLEPTPPKEPKPTKSQSLDIDDLVPDDIGLVDETYKTIYESESTYDIGEIGSVVLEAAENLISKAKKTKTETKIVSHSVYELDDIEGAVVGEELGKIYESHSTYKVEKSLEATELYLSGLALSGGVSFIRGATYTVNPLAWAEGLHDLTYLARSRYAQKQFAKHAAEDPLRFLVDKGATIAGGYYAGKFIGNIFFDTPDELKYDLPETELSRVIKRTDGRISPREYDLVSVKQKVLHKVAGWDEIPVAQVDELGSGFSAYNPPRGAWPKPVKGFWAKSTGEGLILTESMIIPTSTYYKPRIDYLSGLKGLSPSIPDLIWLQTIVPGQSLSAYPFMGMGAVIGLSSGIAPDIDDPLGVEKLDTIQEVIPNIDDTGLDEIPKIIEMVDETYIQEQKLVDPMTILKPIHDPKQDPLIEPEYEPYPPEEVPVIIERLDEDVIPILIPPSFIPKQTQEPQQEEPYIPPVPVPLDLFDPARPQIPRPPRPTPKKTRRSKQYDTFDPMGWEMRKYPVPDIEDIIGIDFSQKTKKKKKGKTKRKRKKKK